MKNYLVLIFVLVFLLSSFSVFADDKITAEEVISKHLDSIAKESVRKSIKNQLGMGESEFIAPRNGGSLSKGRVVVASENNKFLLGMSFTIPSYPFEKIGFDGNKLKVANVVQSNRSPLGNFISSFGEVITEGLLGGTLTNAWSPLELSTRKAKIEFGGTKKVDGKEAYIVKYYPQSGSDLKISLFFDKENFNHIRTEYRCVVAAGMGTSTGIDAARSGSRVDNSAKQSETRYLLLEEFSDYKKTGELTLPHSYKIYYSLDTTRVSTEFEWKINIAQFYFNQNLPASSFDIDAK